MKKVIVKRIFIESDEKTGEEHKSILVKDGEEEEVLLVSDKVRLYEDREMKGLAFTHIRVGDQLDVYYKENTPLLMSYPGQYSPDVIVLNKNNDYMSHKYSFFDEDLISQDNKVKINKDFLTKIEDYQDEDLIKNLIKNRYLLIFYKASTRSIPAQVNPEKIIIF